MENNKVAVITGATSGIGKEYALALAKKGYNLILTGRRDKILKTTEKEIKDATGVKINTYILDLTNEEDFNLFIKELDKRDDIEFLVNNAGYGALHAFTEGGFEEQADMLKVHVLATMKLCYYIVKKMNKNKRGYIINVSSMAGFNTFPSSAMYCSTKAFLISFSQCLAMEVKRYNIIVQGLCPGFTRTDFHSKLDMDEKMLKNKGIVKWMTTKEVVDISLKNLSKNLKIIVIPGFYNKVLYYISKFAPKKIYYKVAMKGWDLMD